MFRVFDGSAGVATAGSSVPSAPGDGPGINSRAIVVCDQWLGSDGYAGMKALRRAGWDVHVVPEWEYVPARYRSLHMKAIGKLMRPLAVREYNRELELQARRLEPAMLLVFKGTWVQPTAIRALRSQGVRCYNYYTDVSFRAHGVYIPQTLPEYDWIFTTKTFGLDDMRQQLGITRASHIQFAFDPDLHRPVPMNDRDEARYSCDVSYIGTWSPKKEQLLTEVARRRPDVHLRIWGEYWNNARSAAIRGAIGGREVLGNEFVRALLGTKINLSIMSEARKGSSRGDQVANRTFAVPACGAFVLHERSAELLELFREDEHLACFDDADEMIEKIAYYLTRPQLRKQIAEQGRELVWREHSWDRRVGTIIAHFMRDMARTEGAAAG
jgi:spore maturation protein CgeB